jgi:hypothetical protein
MTTAKAWSAATATFDLAVQDIERRWGKNRLEGLASPELREKYETAKDQLAEACAAGDIDLAARKAAALARGLQALEAYALGQGHKAEELPSWAISVGSRRYLVVRQTYEVLAAVDRHPGEKVIAVEELLRLQLATEEGRFLVAAKDRFPAAVVTHAGPPRSKVGEMVDDAIPW